ncbi:MAG: cardiolipin synthase [Lachnospiraceae bacterium]|nr:cardiolipin synthase [Lachnospiraceae bacterium]
MKKTLQVLFRIVFSRTMITILLILLQIGVLLASFNFFRPYMSVIFGSFTFLAGVLIVYIINKDILPEMKLVWVLPICVFPVFGALLYLMVATNWGTIGLKKVVQRGIQSTSVYLKTSEEVTKSLQEDVSIRQLSSYIQSISTCPTYQNTRVTYFPLGEDKFKDLLVELEKAEKFIFLEYFIIERGRMWNSILEVLERKAQEGVEVRVMYDGMCSLLLLPYTYPKQLQKKGIQAKMVSPIKPMLSTHQNNRDHRKILVIDGRVAYNGGVNLADEYINEKVIYGHWKDVAVKLEGDAVQGFTALFLQMWNAEETTEKMQQYLKLPQRNVESAGYVIPYGDVPTDGEQLGETVYIDILNRAKKYVHIMTPYLILDYQMVTALTYAAKRGVDVSIIMPHIPDKKIPFEIARSFYPELLHNKVKIYEYTPGFVHAKCFVSDDEKAVVGTINLDYRSLYHHFECATYIYRNPVIGDIEMDYQKTLLECQQVEMGTYRQIPLLQRIMGRVYRIIAPLL